MTVVSNTTDRETMDTYVLLVHAQDGGGLLNTTSLTITVLDVNDNPPVFLRTHYEATLYENTNSFTQPLRVEVRVVAIQRSKIMVAVLKQMVGG